VLLFLVTSCCQLYDSFSSFDTLSAKSTHDNMDEIAPEYDVIVLGTGEFAAPHRRLLCCAVLLFRVPPWWGSGAPGTADSKRNGQRRCYIERNGG
jgi:hypothetical protein